MKYDLRTAIKSARDSSRNGFVGFVSANECGRWRGFGYVSSTFRQVACPGMFVVGANESIASAETRIRSLVNEQ